LIGKHWGWRLSQDLLHCPCYARKFFILAPGILLKDRVNDLDEPLSLSLVVWNLKQICRDLLALEAEFAKKVDVSGSAVL
jgi:hypothetical protein